jgi:hypothetical protein
MPKLPIRRLEDIKSLLQRRRIMILIAPPPVLSLTIRQLPPNNSNMSRLESWWESWRISITPEEFTIHIAPSTGVRWRFIYDGTKWRAEWHALRHLEPGDGEMKIEGPVADAIGLLAIYHNTLTMLSEVSAVPTRPVAPPPSIQANA